MIQAHNDVKGCGIQLMAFPFNLQSSAGSIELEAMLQDKNGYLKYPPYLEGSR